MKRKSFLWKLLASTAVIPYFAFAKTMNKKNNFRARLIRHATLLIEVGNIKLLVDPMLSPKNQLDPVQNCGNDLRFPMVELPITKEELERILKEVDAALVTHTHRDHWDVAAQNLIDKNKLIFCQPSDTSKIREQAFNNVHSIESNLKWNDITIQRTGGKHGTGEIGKKMGEVSGFILNYDNESLYIVGDSIWCREVEIALDEHKPTTVILNTGGAKFLTGDPITMTPDDLEQVYRKRPEAQIVAVHMDTVNHCFIKRKDLQKALSEKGLITKIRVPADGEWI